MALPEFVTPIVSIASPAALLYVILRYGPVGVVRLLAGIVAIITSDEKRGQRCVEVLLALRSGRAPGATPGDSAPGSPASSPPPAPGPSLPSQPSSPAPRDRRTGR